MWRKLIGWVVWVHKINYVIQLALAKFPFDVNVSCTSEGVRLELNAIKKHIIISGLGVLDLNHALSGNHVARKYTKLKMSN